MSVDVAVAPNGLVYKDECLLWNRAEVSKITPWDNDGVFHEVLKRPPVFQVCSTLPNFQMDYSWELEETKTTNLTGAMGDPDLPSDFNQSEIRSRNSYSNGSVLFEFLE